MSPPPPIPPKPPVKPPQNSDSKSEPETNKNTQPQPTTKNLPPPVPNRKMGDLSPQEMAILFPPDEDDDDNLTNSPTGKVAEKNAKQASPNLPPPNKRTIPPVNFAVIAQAAEAKAEKENAQKSLFVKSIVEKKQKQRRKTLILTLVLSVVGAIVFTVLMAYLIAPANLQKFDSETAPIEQQNNNTIPPKPNDNEDREFELLAPTESEE
ncbi:MAG: hypothetical protein LBQ66_04740 [Planctomycetaceae bacterium]|jgi:hypothetical protein|nr:hypothetical protein [Planctomycetaceae bacterium]